MITRKKATTTPLKSLSLGQKPYMESKTYAIFLKQWPDEDVDIMVTSPHIGFEEYTLDDAYRELVIPTMLSNLQRLKEYPKRGSQVYLEIPDVA